MAEGGACPSCGQVLAAPAQVGATRAPAPVGASSGPKEAAVAPVPGPAGAPVAGPTMRAQAKKAPWHFKLLLVGVTVYMVYRIYWLVEWLPKHI